MSERESFLLTHWLCSFHRLSSDVSSYNHTLKTSTTQRLLSPGAVSMGMEGVSGGVVLRDTRFISSTTKKSGQLFRNCTHTHTHSTIIDCEETSI